MSMPNLRARGAYEVSASASVHRIGEHERHNFGVSLVACGMQIENVFPKRRESTKCLRKSVCDNQRSTP